MAPTRQLELLLYQVDRTDQEVHCTEDLDHDLSVDYLSDEV